MNVMFLLSPLILSLVGITVIFVGILFALDMRRTNHQNHLRKLMRAFVATNAMRSFSVITETSEGAESIAPLLASLEEQGYPKLQVIVFISATANNDIMSDLRRIQRRKKNNLRLRIIRRKPSDDERALIKRYADGEALVWLRESDRISSDFFTRISVELLDESRQAFAPRVTLKVDDTIGSASRALQLVARQTIATITHRSIPERLIIRRSSYLNNEVGQPLSVEHVTVIVNEVSKNKHSVYIEVLLLLTIIAVGAISSIFIPYNWYIVTLAYIGIIVLLMILRLITYPYSLWSKSALVLLIPLWPLIALVTECGTTVKLIWSRFRKHRTQPA